MSKHKSWYTGAYPRQYDKHEPLPISDVSKPLPSTKWKKKYKCKKNKGDHDWAVLSVSNCFEYAVQTSYGKAYGSWRPGQENRREIPVHKMGIRSDIAWRCRACDKHEREILCSDPTKSMFSFSKKRLDPYRQNYL